MGKGTFAASLPRLLLVSIAACALGLLLFGAVPVKAASPGSASDPLVTQDWVEDYVQRAFEPLHQRIDQMEQNLGWRVNIVLTIGSREALVNGKAETVPTSPQIMGAGYTMVPARFIGEALGLKVDWDDFSRQVTFSGQGQNVTLTIGRTTAGINGQAYTMPMAPVIAGAYTLVHVRFVSEAFRCQVGWDPKTRQVTITK